MYGDLCIQRDPRVPFVTNATYLQTPCILYAVCTCIRMYICTCMPYQQLNLNWPTPS